MGATYLSMQLRTTDRERVVGELSAIAAKYAGTGSGFYVGEASEGWIPVFPSFTPELEHSAKDLSLGAGCLVLLLLSVDEDDLYFMFFRDGKQLPWFKVAAGRVRRGKEREKLAAKLEVLADVCDDECRARLVAVLADSPGVNFSSDLMRSVCDILGIRNAFTSFDYLQRGEREGPNALSEPRLVSG